MGRERGHDKLRGVLLTRSDGSLIWRNLVAVLCLNAAGTFMLRQMPGLD